MKPKGSAIKQIERSRVFIYIPCICLLEKSITHSVGIEALQPARVQAGSSGSHSFGIESVQPASVLT